MEDSKLENVVRKAAILFGTALLIASIFLSYDGFDQKVSGGNDGYTMLAVAIGYSLAVACTILEFIVASRSENLNSTLKLLGLGAYAYSIYTNVLGLQHLLQMDVVMAWISGVFMDVTPEQMIAWGLGEAVMHDLFGNFGKFMTSPVDKKDKHKNQQGQGGGGDNPKGDFNKNNGHDRRKDDRRDQNHIPRDQRIAMLRQQYPAPKPHQEPTYHPVGMDAKEEGFTPYHRENGK